MAKVYFVICLVCVYVYVCFIYTYAGGYICHFKLLKAEVFQNLCYVTVIGMECRNVITKE